MLHPSWGLGESAEILSPAIPRRWRHGTTGQREPALVNSSSETPVAPRACDWLGLKELCG